MKPWATVAVTVKPASNEPLPPLRRRVQTAVVRVGPYRKVVVIG